MFEFLGHVNRLPDADGGGVATFARPHEIGVRANAVGVGACQDVSFTGRPSARSRGSSSRSIWTSGTVNVELPPDQYRKLALRAGEVAYLTPLRRHAFAAG